MLPIGIEVGEGGHEMFQAPTEAVNLPDEEVSVYPRITGPA
jgi:hypothetical protein